MNGAPACWPRSCTARMFGWFSAAAARASCSNRASRSGSAADAVGRTLIATSRPSRESRARYTSPMPPAPSTESTSYGPSREPVVSGMDESANYRCKEESQLVQGGTRSVQGGARLVQGGSRRCKVDLGRSKVELGPCKVDPGRSKVDLGPSKRATVREVRLHPLHRPASDGLH